MNGNRLIVALVIVSVGAVALVASFLFAGHPQEQARPRVAPGGQISSGLGITYLPLTRGLSEYYGLGVDSGALVTEVASGSPAERAGVQAGDVILSFNGDRPEERASLLGMMMACPAGNTATLEVWRHREVKTIRLFHGER